MGSCFDYLQKFHHLRLAASLKSCPDLMAAMLIACLTDQDNNNGPGHTDLQQANRVAWAVCKQLSEDTQDQHKILSSVLDVVFSRAGVQLRSHLLLGFATLVRNLNHMSTIFKLSCYAICVNLCDYFVIQCLELSQIIEL
jgi:hypothetical protein